MSAETVTLVPMSDKATGIEDTPLNRAAENAILKLVARFSMCCVLPLAATIGWFVWTTVAETSLAIHRIDITLTQMSGLNNLLSARVDGVEKTANSRIELLDKSTVSRFTGVERRVDKNDADIDKLKERLYALPGYRAP